MKVVLAKTVHITQSAEILKKAYFESLKEAKEFLKEKLRKKECYVAVENNRVLGLFTYRRDYTHYANYLSNIVVADEHRRKGIAKEFLKKYIEISRKEQPKKQKYALSSTDVTNKISIDMHLNFGFKDLGRIKKLHYGKDEIIFGYKLY